MFSDQSVRDFLNSLAGKNATPGGGSVAALNGAMGAALVSMVCNVTLGKKKYAEVEAEVQSILSRSEQLRPDLTALAADDSAAFEQVMAAFKLPKQSEEKKQARANAIQSAFKTATIVPLATAQACAEVLSMSKIMAQIGNTNAISDAGAGALAAQAGLKSAALNVLINLGSIKDEAFVADTEAALKNTLAGMDELTDEIYNLVKSKI